MPYTIFMILLMFGIGGAMAALITGIVMACKRKWKRVLVFASLTILCGFLGVLGGAGLVIKAGIDATGYVKREIAAVRARQEAKVDAIKALTPGVDWTKVDDEFWNYDGYRDWWRVPVRWPYEVQSIDTFDRGSLRRNIASGKSKDPNSQGEDVSGVYDLTHYACDGKIFVFRQEARAKARWGILEFDSKLVEIFDTEDDMWSAAKKRGWTGPAVLPSVKENYDHFWIR